MTANELKISNLVLLNGKPININWQGKAKIVLHPENEFELDLIEKVKDSRVGYETNTEVLTDYSYHSHTKHRIEISLIENEKKKP